MGDRTLEELLAFREQHAGMVPCAHCSAPIPEGGPCVCPKSVKAKCLAREAILAAVEAALEGDVQKTEQERGGSQ